MQTAEKRAVSYAELVVTGLSLGVIFILLLLSAIIMYDPALGWFARNVRVKAQNTEVVVAQDAAHAEYECYVYLAKESAVEVQDLDALDLQPYDMIFSRRNRYTPAIVRIELSDISYQYASGGTLNVTLKRNTLLPNNVLDDYFTSIMRVTAVVGNTYYSADPDTLYTNLDTALYTTVKAYPENYSSASSKLFTTVTGGTGTDLDPYVYLKADVISLTVPYTTADMNGSVLNLYLYLSYDESLVHKYQAAEGIDTNSTVVGRTVPLPNDVKSIAIAFS